MPLLKGHVRVDLAPSLEQRLGHRAINAAPPLRKVL